MIGVINAVVTSDDTEVRTTFQVTRKSTGALLGCCSAEALHLVHFAAQVQRKWTIPCRQREKQVGETQEQENERSKKKGSESPQQEQLQVKCQSNTTRRAKGQTDTSIIASLQDSNDQGDTS